MSGIDDLMMEITPEVLLKAYACGIFPMAESANDPGLYWVEPKMRGIIPLETFHIPRRLARTVRQGIFEVTADKSFNDVIRLCAEDTPGRPNTWINGRIAALYRELHAVGHCHSIECWKDDTLVGGLYGVRLGGVFFGESMFSRSRDASKVALVHLVERMKLGGFCLLDTQFHTGHLSQFGAIEIPKRDYEILLQDALSRNGDFFATGQQIPT